MPVLLIFVKGIFSCGLLHRSYDRLRFFCSEDSGSGNYYVCSCRGAPSDVFGVDSAVDLNIDGDTAQVGPQISEHLGIPVISYAQNIKIEGDSVIVERQYDDRYHVLKAQMPCLITALAELNEPRYMTPGGIFDAYDAEITVWGRADLKDVDDSNLGLKGSPTQIAKASDKVRKGAGEKVALDPTEAVDYIVGKLKDKHVI